MVFQNTRSAGRFFSHEVAGNVGIDFVTFCPRDEQRLMISAADKGVENCQLGNWLIVRNKISALCFLALYIQRISHGGDFISYLRVAV
jgi:hypothetical protein